MSDPIAAAVSEYCALGWRVLPLWSIHFDGLEATCTCPKGATCASPGKHPRLPHGVLEASSNVVDASDWWGRWPDANVGLATGPESGIYVVDLDGPDAIAAWAALGLPGGWTSRTGNGLHHVYTLRESLPNTHWKLGQGIDTRGAGGYIVAPPSLHRSMRTYRWEERAGTAPPVLSNAIREALTPSMATPTAPATIRYGESTAYAKGVLRHALERVSAAPEGARNETLNHEAFLLGQWCAGGELDPSGIAEALEHAHPRPCDEKKVRSTIQRGLRDGASFPRTKADE